MAYDLPFDGHGRWDDMETTDRGDLQIIYYELFKDVHGFRPRSDSNSPIYMTLQELKDSVASLSSELNEQFELEQLDMDVDRIFEAEQDFIHAVANKV